jgi:pimeloyl-ACP methyl ester carboxylesterase
MASRGVRTRSPHNRHGRALGRLGFGRIFYLGFHGWPILTPGAMGRLSPFPHHEPFDGLLEGGGRDRVPRLATEQRDRVEPGQQLYEAEESLPAVLGGLGVVDFALFGHSVAGAMALVAASRAGDCCKAVVSESAQAFAEGRTVAGVEAARERFREPEQFDRLKKWHGSKARWVLDAWTEVWLSPGFASWSLEPDLPLVRSPVLVIHGEEDEYGSIRFPQTICRHVGGPAEMHILSGCGHVPHRERPDEVAGLVARFPPLSVGWS